MTTDKDTFNNLRRRGIHSLIKDICRFLVVIGIECKPDLEQIDDFCELYWVKNDHAGISKATNFIMDMHFLSMIEFSRPEDSMIFKLKYDSEKFTKEFRKWQSEAYYQG